MENIFLCSFHSDTKIDTERCSICDYERRMQALRYIFEKVELKDLQKIAPEISEFQFNGFRRLMGYV